MCLHIPSFIFSIQPERLPLQAYWQIGIHPLNFQPAYMFLHKKIALNQYPLQNTHVPLNYSSETLDAQDKALPGVGTGTTMGAEMMEEKEGRDRPGVNGGIFQSDQYRIFYVIKRPHQEQSELQGNIPVALRAWLAYHPKTRQRGMCSVK